MSGGTDALFRGAVEEAEVVADVVGELGQQFGADHVELVLGRREIRTFDDYRGGGVAEDEVAVAVTEIQVTGADFRVDHQDRPGLAQLHAVGRSLDAEGRRGTGDVHVETEPLNTQRFLDFDGDGRVGALQVGAGDDHTVDVSGGLAGALQGLFGRTDSHLAKHRPLVIRALGQAWCHALRVEDAVFVHDKAAF